MRRKPKSKSPLGDGLFRDPFVPDDEEDDKDVDEEKSEKPSSKKDEDDPEDDDTGIEKAARSVWSFVKRHWWLFVVVAGVIALFIGGWTGFAVGLLLLSFAFIMRYRSQEKVQKYVEKHWLWLLPVAIIGLSALPVLGPMAIAYYGKAKRMNWEERANPPMICYFWIVDLDKFNAAQKDALASWNPGPKENQLIREALRSGAIIAELQVDQVVHYTEEQRDMLNCHALVVFQGVTIISDPPSADLPLSTSEGGGDAGAPVYRNSKLLVHFKVIEAGGPPIDLKLDGGSEANEPQAVSIYAPDDLHIDYRFFADGLGKARNRPVNFDQVPSFIEERMREAEKNRANLKDGPGSSEL